MDTSKKYPLIGDTITVLGFLDDEAGGEEEVGQ